MKSFNMSAWHLQRAPQSMHSAVAVLASRRKVCTQWSVAQEIIVFHMTELLLLQEVKKCDNIFSSKKQEQLNGRCGFKDSEKN